MNKLDNYALALRGEFINELIESGNTPAEVEELLSDKRVLSFVNAMMQSLAEARR